MVELAVALPILLLLAIAVADYARVYYAAIVVASAAQAGVHYGVAFDGDPDSMTVSAQRDAGSVSLDAVNVGKYCSCPAQGVVDCATTSCTDVTYGQPQIFDTVQVRKDVPLFIRYAAFPATFTITRTAVLRQR